MLYSTIIARCIKLQHDCMPEIKTYCNLRLSVCLRIESRTRVVMRSSQTLQIINDIIIPNRCSYKYLYECVLIEKWPA